MPDQILFRSTRTLIVGCGYLGNRVAQILRAEAPDSQVYVTTRKPAKLAEFARRGLIPLCIDWTDRRSLRNLPPCERLLVAVSYDRSSRLDRESAQVGGLANLLEFVTPTADLCYISTTGVYHQDDGSWVDETSPARPRTDGGLAHLRAEQLLQRRRAAGSWVTLRLAGIYGPGRIPRAADVIAGKTLEGPHAGYLNLIHVEDAARAVLACWGLPPGNRATLYACTDDQPVIRRRFYEKIAELAKVPPPKFALADSQAPRAYLSARSLGNKRIWNRRFRRDLAPRLSFPSYAAGLAALNW